MNKYVIKESELRAVIEGVIMEEFNEGLKNTLGSALKNTAKTAALGAVSPGALAQKAFVKVGNVINGDASLVGGVKKFFGNDQNQNVSNQVRSEYGEPETEGMIGKKLVRKRPIIVANFLGGGDDVNFGRHYYEVNQESERSVWGRKLAQAGRDVNYTATSPGGRRRRIRYYQKLFAKWLNDRDRAYEEYVRNRRRQK